MTDNPGQIGQWLDYIFTYGSTWVYAVIFLACFIENIFPPFPGDSFILATGGLVAAGRLSLLPGLLVIITGGMASVMIMYLIGKKYGREFFMRKDYKYFSAADLVRFERGLQRWGAWLLIGSRFVVGLRSAIAVGAGLARYQPIRMFLFSLVSYALFTGLLFYLSLVVVSNFDRIAHYFKTYNAAMWAAVGCGLIVYIVWKIRKTRART